MTMSAMERQRELGTLMSMGFRRRWILGLFVIESAWLAALAAAAGAVLGWALVSVTHHAGIDFSVSGRRRSTDSARA
jgi:putative ABC transport system permease protein